MSSPPLSIQFPSQETIAERVRTTKKKKKTENGIKILIPNKGLSKLPILLAQIKSENNSYKF